MGQIAGKEGAVSIGPVGTALYLDLDSYDVDEKADLILTKSFRQGGRTAADGAFIDAVVSLKGYFSSEAGDQPLLDHGLYDGNPITDLRLYVTQGVSALFFYFPALLVLTAKCITKTDGRVDFECTLVPLAVWYYPGDVIPP